MRTENPTPLRIGMTGTLNGWRGRIAGRVVVGMDDGGETYYWTEFNLVDGFGRNATLVFEEGENGPEWKFFKAFEPLRAMTAQEAATKRVGDTVQLDGIARRITLVDESRVYHIEGTAPEGVQVGDVARYFNVDTGERMLVASWTGDEIEFFEGEDVTAAAVGTAFGISTSAPSLSPPSNFSANASTGVGAVKWIVGAVALVIVLMMFVSFSGHGSNRPAPSFPSPPPRPPTPPVRLATGAAGTLAGHAYTISAHAVVTLARISGKLERHEYALRDETGHDALLVNGLNGGTREWHLLQPVATPASLTPFTAAALRKSASITVDGRPLVLSDLFLSQLRTADGANASSLWPATIAYGFVAEAGGASLIARWTESDLRLYRGPKLDEAEVIAALGSLQVEK